MVTKLLNNATPASKGTWLFALLTLLLSCGMAQAQDLVLKDAKLSLLSGDMPGAGYFSLQNRSAEPLTLVGAESDVFKNTEIHMSMEKDGMASMQAVPALDIAAGDTLEFAPKGYHLMFMNRLTPLAVGDDVEVILHFADDQQLPATFEVVSPATLH